MPYSFPTLSSGACFVKSDLTGQPLARYPMEQSVGYATRIVRFLNDEEQAWTVHAKLAAFTLTYKAVPGYDVAKVVDFFNIFLGRYTDPAHLFTFSIAVGSSTYDYCVFDQDEIEVAESVPNYFDFSVKIKQVRPN